MRVKLVAGNWKMNGLGGDLVEIERLVSGMGKPGCDVLICPPATLIARMHDLAIGSQLLAGALAPTVLAPIQDVLGTPGQPARHHQLLALEVRAEEARKTPTIGIRGVTHQRTSSMRRRAWAMRPFVSGTL